MGALRRLWGVIVIVRALMPILLVLAVILIVRQIMAEVRQVLTPPIAAINAHAQNMQRTVDATQQALNDLNREVAVMSQTANSINQSLTVSFGNLPLVGNLSKTFDILGVVQIKTVFDQIARLFGGLARVTGISALSQDANAIIREVRLIANALLGIANRWGRALLLIVAITFALMIISYLEYLVRSLRRGWALLRGLPDPWG